MRIILTILFLLILTLYTLSSQPAYPQNTQDTVQKTEPTLIQKGIDLLDQKRFDEALSVFMEASLQDPENPEPHYFAAITFQAKKDLPLALAEIQKAAILAPGRPVIHLRMGMILEQMGRFSEAREAYMGALKAPEVEKGEETPQISGQIKELRERLRRIERRVHFDAARGFMREKRYEDAVKELKALIELDPNNYLPHYLLGMAFKELGSLKEAIEALKKAVEINPGYAEAYAQMGFIYVHAAAFAEAKENLEKFLSLAPESPLAGEVKKGLEKVRELGGVQKKFAVVGNLIKEERWDEALRENQALSEIQPDHHFTLYNFGVISHHFKRREEAIDYLKKAIEKEPRYFLANYHLAKIYDEVGMFPEAIRHLETALTLTMDEEEKKAVQARLDILRPIMEVPEKAGKIGELLEKKDTEGAIKEAETLITAQRKDIKVYLILGRLYTQVNRFEEAVKILEAATQIDPQHIEIRALLSDSYIKVGREAEAVESYKILARLAHNTRMGDYAEERGRILEMKVHFDKARDLKDRGDLEGSLREILAIIGVSPENPIALFNAGVLNDLLDHPKEAESFLRKAIKAAPDYAEAHLQLGLLLEKEKEFIEAEGAYREVMRLQTEGGDAYNLARGRMEELKDVVEITERTESILPLMDKKDFEGALREAEAVIAIYPNNYLAYFYMGIIYDLTENPDEAIDALQKTIDIKPSFLRAYLLLAKILVTQDKFGEARDVYGRLAEIGRGTREGEIAAIQLKRLRPWGGNFSLSHTYNTNISYGIKAEPTFQSVYGLGFTYRTWRTKKGGVNMGGTASENIYYTSQLTGQGYSLFVNGDYSLSKGNEASFSMSRSRGYFENKTTSKGFSASTLVKISSGLAPGPLTLNYSFSSSKALSSKTVNTTNNVSIGISPGTIPTSLSLSSSFSKSRSARDSTRDSNYYSAGISIGQRLGLRSSMSGSYSFSVNANTDPRGNNYGNRSHNLSLSYSRSFFSKYSLSLSYSRGLIQYMNPDSTTFFQQFRRNTTQSSGIGLSFPFSEQVGFSLRYNYSQSRTNLPRPTSELLLTLEEILSEPIPMVGGDYGSQSVTMSLSVRF